MSRFRKKGVVIDAFRWTGGPDQTEDPEWIVAALKNGAVWIQDSGLPTLRMRIVTAEGVMTAWPGDWIIRGVKGELYPCKADIFAATYEPEVEVSPDITAEAVDFFFVWTKTGYVPRRRHTTEAAAMREAERLARKDPGKKFIILRATTKLHVSTEQKEQP